MRICYLSEGTPLCGGVKVTFEQAEALQERGHQVEVLSKGERPSWYPPRVPFRQVRDFLPATLPECDVIVGTFWTTVYDAVQSGKGRPVHLCQGYEGDTAAFAIDRPAIEAAYRLPTLLLTVHEPLTQLIAQRFGRRAHTVGQGINRWQFFPARQAAYGTMPRVLLVGPCEIDWKGVQDGLVALKKLKEELSFQLVRVSQFACHPEEAALQVTDEYHCHLPAENMPAIYRSCDVMLSPSWTQEGFGLPTLEAMACGVPVAISDIPAFRAFAETQDWALFFAERDIAGMRLALRRLLTDDELRQRQRSRGLAVARQYTFARVAERIEQVLQSV
ncbi:MAG: glycosyltransferase family 4 protein [Deltaproteobacteria bacterium]|nr:glycosyltransferase family 4 protein [Deltaproteobacteria bacterium]